MTLTASTPLSLAQLGNCLKQFRPGPDGPPLVVAPQEGTDPVALSRQNVTRFLESGIPPFFDWAATMRAQLDPDTLRPMDYRPLEETGDDWERSVTFFRPSYGHLIRVSERSLQDARIQPSSRPRRQYRFETGYGYMSDREIVQETLMNDRQVTAMNYGMRLRGTSLGVIADSFGYKKAEASQVVGEMYSRLVGMMVTGASAAIGMRIEGQGEHPENRRVDPKDLQESVPYLVRRFRDYRAVSIGPLYRSSQVAGLNDFQIRYGQADDSAGQLDFSLRYIVDSYSALPTVPPEFLPLWRKLLQDYTD